VDSSRKIRALLNLEESSPVDFGGQVVWLIRGTEIRHRLDGPAVYTKDGFYRFGPLARYEPLELYYIRGKPLNAEEFKEHIRRWQQFKKHLQSK
jgi:hypothetical protein